MHHIILFPLIWSFYPIFFEFRVPCLKIKKLDSTKKIIQNFIFKISIGQNNTNGESTKQNSNILLPNKLLDSSN